MRFSLRHWGMRLASAGAVAAGMWVPCQAQTQTAEVRLVRGISLTESDDGDEQSKEKTAEVVQVRIEAPKYWLGIALKPIEGDLAAYLGSSDGVLVESVVPDSPASQAGLKSGDILTAVNGDPLTDPKSLLSHMNSIRADEQNKLPVQKFGVLRKGQALTVELTPAERPKGKEEPGESEVLILTEDIEGASDAVKRGEEWLSKIRTPDGLSVLRFGAPLVWNAEGADGGNLKLHIVDSRKSGGVFEINVNREDGKPAKITVNRNGETKVYSEGQIDEIPAEVRETVKGMLSNGVGKRVEVKVGESGGSPQALWVAGREVMNPEMLERYQKMAKQMAERSKEWAKDAAAMPKQMIELRSEVESLRKELKELREQLSDSKK